MSTDANLIRRSLAEPEAFAELYDRHAAAIGRFAARRLGDHAGEDVLAETFLTAFRRRDRYDCRYPDARPWLYGIAVRLIGRHRRDELRLYRALARSGADAGATSDDGVEQIDARLSAVAQQRAITAALAELPAGHRDVLLLFAWAELSYEEIAEALNVPVGTVRSRLSRARRALREALPASLHQEMTHGRA